MKLIESIFREYDIRGTYPKEINEVSIAKIGKAIALKCKKEKVTEICVGRAVSYTHLTLPTKA